MNLLRLGLLALTLGAASCASVATETLQAPPQIGRLERPSYLQCLHDAHGRLEQAPCIANEAKWQREQLDLAYKALHAKLDAKQRAELEKAQAAWEAFMEAENRFAVSVYYPQPGSSDLSVSTNEILWIIQRRQQLQRHLDLNE